MAAPKKESKATTKKQTSKSKTNSTSKKGNTKSKGKTSKRTKTKKDGFFKRLSEISTMKKWGLASWGGVIVLTSIFIYGTFCTEKDMEVFAGIVALAWGELTAYNVAYAWKEKAQNKLKITYGFIEKLAKQYGLEALEPFLQSIISD